MHGVRIAMRPAAVIAALAVSSVALWAQPKRISNDQAMEAALTKVQPAYPAVAKQLNIEGGVELEATIDADGSVDRVNIVSGNPVLTKPSVEALKKWKFKPFTDGGKPVQAVAPFHFTFRKNM